MNEFGRLAMDHWRRWLPSRFSQIEDPVEFFTSLGQDVATQIDAVEESLLAEPTPSRSGGYLAEVGRLTAIRRQAREIVLNELVWLDPEPGTNPDEELEPPDGLSRWMDPQGMPWDRDHPLWAMREDETVSSAQFLEATAAWEASLRARLAAEDDSPTI